MGKFVEDFKAFAMKGNVVDMAVGVIVGGAFGKITTTLVDGIIMPLISMITGGVDFSAWKWVLKAESVDGVSTVVTPEVAVRYGDLISVILNFIIIAFVIFLMIKGMNKLHKKEEVEEPAPEEPAAPTTEELLGEIRDLLKEQNK